MKFITILVLLALSYGTDGQTDLYFDIGTQLMLDGTSAGSPSTERNICFDGTNVYYTDGSDIIRQSDGETVVNTGGPTVYSISCLCNVLVYAYSSEGSTFVSYYDTGDSGISIVLEVVEEEQRVAVELSEENGLIIVGAFDIWQYDKIPLSTTRRSFTFDVGNLDNFPRCIASYAANSDLIVFVTYETETNVQAITVTSEAAPNSAVPVTERDVRQANRLNARVACVDVADDTIYFLTRLQTNADWELDSYDIAGWLTGSELYSETTVVDSGSNGNLVAGIHGLVVCGTNCPGDCEVTCDCDGCGFCIGCDGTCQCEDSGQEGCSYEDPTMDATCFVPEPPLDSYCIVDQPLAPRRRGDPIRIVGAAIVESDIVVSRLAQTGRWNTNTLPSDTQFTGNDGTVWFDGFSADVPSSGRGRRFGVYVAEISPMDPNLNSVEIPCIATESSGFYNRFYTYTRSIGDSVTLVATFNDRLQDSEASVRWLFTGFDSGSPLDEETFSDCNGQLSCTLNDLDVSDEGVYQVYRRNLNRQKRTWHPIFYLYVRACADGSFGPPICAGACPECVYGVCDEISGLCTCKPGWTGALCDTECDEGYVGQTCEMQCSAIFPDRGDCNWLSFCAPGKVGCSCYPGLEPPECSNECEGDSCGPNCEYECNDPADCDPRTCGTIP